VKSGYSIAMNVLLGSDCSLRLTYRNLLGAICSIGVANSNIATCFKI